MLLEMHISFTTLQNFLRYLTLVLHKDAFLRFVEELINLLGLHTLPSDGSQIAIYLGVDGSSLCVQDYGSLVTGLINQQVVKDCARLNGAFICIN